MSEKPNKFVGSEEEAESLLKWLQKQQAEAKQEDKPDQPPKPKVSKSPFEKK